MIKKQKGLVPILIILLVAAVISGFLLYQKQFKPAFVPQSSPSSVSDSIDTSYWETYTSSTAHYSFKYPSREWPLVNMPIPLDCGTCVEIRSFATSYNPDKPIPGDTTLGVITVYRKPKIQSLEDYVNIYVKKDKSIIDLNYTLVNGEKAISYRISGGTPPLPIIEYAVVKNGYQYIIRIEDSKETNKNRERNIQIFNKILSSFEVLDQTKTNKITSWKTYTNTEYGFSFQYPYNWYFNATDVTTVKDRHPSNKALFAIFTANPEFDKNGLLIAKKVDLLGVQIIIWPKNNKSLQDVISEYDQFYGNKPSTDQSIKTINQIEWRVRNFENASNVPSIDYITDKGQYMYVIDVFPANSEILDISDQILSTFKFTQ